MLASDNIKKISFATSFRVSKVPRLQEKMTKYYLERIDCLSGHESSRSKIVKDLTGRKAIVTLNPTLMLSTSEWYDFFPYRKISKEPYIFAYFLEKNPEHRKAVTELGRNLRMKIITCHHLDYYVKADNDFGDEQCYELGPIEFLNMIRGAEYICTDSFMALFSRFCIAKNFLLFIAAKLVVKIREIQELIVYFQI